MNEVHDRQDDWQAMAKAWREQPGSRLDTDALLKEVRRRGRRLRWALVSEVATMAVVLVLCGRVLLSPDVSHFTRLVVGVLTAMVLGFQGWALWIRRGQVRDSGRDANAMIALDIARTRTTLRYWRVSTWVAVAMWLGLYAVAWSTLASPSPGDAATLQKLVHSVMATGLVGFGAAVWAWWWSARHRRRLASMLSLRDELQQG